MFVHVQFNDIKILSKIVPKSIFETSYRKVYANKMEYKNMKLSELREVAKSRGLKGWMALKKNDLREFLINDSVKKPSTSKPKQIPSTSKPKQIPSISNTDALLERVNKLEKENRRLRQQQTDQTLNPPLVPTPYKPPTPPTPIPKSRTKAKAAKNSWYDWLVSHVPEAIRSATSRIKRQILSLYDNTEPREFEISSSESAFACSFSLEILITFSSH